MEHVDDEILQRAVILSSNMAKFYLQYVAFFLLTKIMAARNEAALCHHGVCGLYFLADILWQIFSGRYFVATTYHLLTQLLADIVYVNAIENNFAVCSILLKWNWRVFARMRGMISRALTFIY